MANRIQRYNLKFGAATDKGLTRSQNQDRFGVFSVDYPGGKNESGHVIVVADGMGGYTGGDVAAQITVDQINKTLKSVSKNPQTDLSRAIRAAYEGIVDKISWDPSLRDMGTTASVLLYTREKVYTVHIGDSRIYRFDSNGLYQISMDHSLANELARGRLITEEQARNHPDRNILVKALMGSSFIEPDIYEPIAVKPGDVFMVCSDGLWNMIADEDIRRVVLSTEAQEAADKLVTMANQNGGLDNITLVIMKVEDNL